VDIEFGIGNDVKQMEYKFCKILSGVKNKKRKKERRNGDVNWTCWKCSLNTKRVGRCRGGLETAVLV